MVLSRENKGTERETPGPALGICQFHLSYLWRSSRTEECFSRRPHQGRPRSDVLSESKIMADSVEIQFVRHYH